MKSNNTSLRTLELIELLSRYPDGLTLSKSAKLMNVPVTSLHNIVQALLERDYIKKTGKNNKEYVIGLKMFLIGSAYISNEDVINKSNELIKELSYYTDRTVYIGKYINNEIIYIYKQPAPYSAITDCEVGSRNELHCTAIGKIYLAFGDETSYIGAYTKYTSRTITNKSDLEKEIKQVKKLGYSVDNREHKSTIVCFAAPIFDGNNNLIAAISTSGVYTDELDFVKNEKIIRKYAKKISQRLV